MVALANHTEAALLFNQSYSRDNLVDVLFLVLIIPLYAASSPGALPFINERREIGRAGLYDLAGKRVHQHAPRPNQRYNTVFPSIHL